MSTSKPGLHVILPTVYAVAVIICLSLAFDFDGRVNGTWTLILFWLTLPWSVVMMVFAWPIFHGARLESFAVLFLGLGGLNAYLMNRLTLALRRAPTKSDP